MDRAILDGFFQCIGVLALFVAAACAVDSRALLVVACTAAALREAKAAFAKAYMASYRSRWISESKQEFPQQQQQAEYSGSGGTL